MRYVIKLVLPDKDCTYVAIDSDSIDEALLRIANMMYDGQVTMLYRPTRYYGEGTERYRYPVNMKLVIFAQYAYTETE